MHENRRLRNDNTLLCHEPEFYWPPAGLIRHLASITDNLKAQFKNYQKPAKTCLINSSCGHGAHLVLISVKLNLVNVINNLLCLP